MKIVLFARTLGSTRLCKISQESGLLSNFGSLSKIRNARFGRSRPLGDNTYREVVEEYVNSKVLPALREKHREFVLKELVKRWENHKIMVGWLSWFFGYLDWYFIPKCSLLPLIEVGLICFPDLVYAEIKDAVIALVNREREGEQIDRALVKNLLGIFEEIGMGNRDAIYETDFEIFMLKDTIAYYRRKASLWIQEASCPDYMLKVEECLKKEKERVSHYLRASSEQMLLEKVQHELLTKYKIQLLEKEHSGCHILLTDDKVDDLVGKHTLQNSCTYIHLAQLVKTLDFLPALLKSDLCLQVLL